MKSLKAEKCNDCWSVEIIDRQTAFSESDVYKLIRQNGLELQNKSYKLNKKGEETDEIIRIFAD